MMNAATPSSPSSSASFFRNKVVVVTGGGSGIGKALCMAFAKAGAFVAVIDLKGSLETQQTLPPRPSQHFHYECDVTDPVKVVSMIDAVKCRYGGNIDIYCSNAGIVILSKNPTDDSVTKHSLSDWDRILQVNLLSHVTALRELLPIWEKKKQGGDNSSRSAYHFCVTASAAGLLTMVGDASYGVSKAAALSLCEHVAISHPSINVHCLCPQAVDTPLIGGKERVGNDSNSASGSNNDANAAMLDGVLSPDQVAACTLRAIERNDFFIFPHPQVPKYALRKAQDHARWLKGMQRLRNKMISAPFPSEKEGGPTVNPVGSSGSPLQSKL